MGVLGWGTPNFSNSVPLLVTTAGGRLWHFKYRVGGVEKLLTLGAYPDVSLKRAREKRDDARRALADGIDPAAKRRAESDAKANTFLALLTNGC